MIANEPVSALDVSIQSQILNLLTDLTKNLGLTIIFISHDLSVVRYMADRIAVMKKGEIVEYDDVERVFTASEHPYTQLFFAAVTVI